MRTRSAGRWFLPVTVLASTTALLVPAASVRAEAATIAPTSCRAKMSGTFLQPSFPVFAWSSARYDRELTDMRNVGIRFVIDQWTVDMDAGEAYYAAPTVPYRQGPNMVGSLLAAAGRQGTGVWLGLGNVYNWQAHATDDAWLTKQLEVDKRIAADLWARYPGKIQGWYISNEVDDKLLSNPAAVGPMKRFFTALTDYLHTNAGNLRVMTSPTYSGLNQSPAQFAHSVKDVLGAVDVLNVQDGGGSGYIEASDITNWFSALSAALAGTGTALWSDPDMYQVGRPMDPARLRANLNATCGYAAVRTGFSFTTQMSPTTLGTDYYYKAYKKYVSGRM